MLPLELDRLNVKSDFRSLVIHTVNSRQISAVTNMVGQNAAAITRSNASRNDLNAKLVFRSSVIRIVHTHQIMAVTNLVG